MKLASWDLLWRQTLELTRANLKSRYRKTLAGLLWVMINPIVMFSVQCLVFKRFLRMNMPDFYLFLISGLLPWIFMTQTIQMGASALTTNAHLLRAFRIHPGVLVAAAALDNFVNFFLAFLLIMVPVALQSDQGAMGLLLAPLVLLPFIIGTFALTMLAALLNVFFRDTSFVLGFIFSVLFFATPIFYPVAFVPPEYRFLIDFNPLYQLMRPFRDASYGRGDWHLSLLTGLTWAAGLTAVAAFYWKRKRNELHYRL